MSTTAKTLIAEFGTREIPLELVRLYETGEA
jgi:hypothetical protein